MQRGKRVRTLEPDLESYKEKKLDPESKLKQAILQNSPEEVRAVIESEYIDINKVTMPPFGFPILHTVCRQGQVELLKLLLQHPEIDVNLPGPSFGDSALYQAVFGGQAEAAKILISDERVDVNMKGALSATPFFTAICRRMTDVAVALLKRRELDAHCPDSDGCTSLWQAAYEGHLDIVKYMIASGHDLDVMAKSSPTRSCQGDLTALDVAKRRKKMDVFRLLQSFITNPDSTRESLRVELDWIGPENPESVESVENVENVENQGNGENQDNNHHENENQENPEPAAPPANNHTNEDDS